MQKLRFVLLMIISLLLITGCSTSPQVDKAQKKWDALGITNYHIVIRFYENFANGIETQRDVTVRDGRVERSACIQEVCPAFVLAEVYTVDDLFSVARGSTLASLSMLDDYTDCVQRLEFEETYGFPREMSIDCSGAIDEEHTFQVISFEELK